jgi:hypothetical protein
MGCNVHVTTGWIQLQYGGTIPTSLTHWSRYCTYRLFQSNYFWYLSTRMGPTLCSFQHAPMGCNVHVTTVDEFNSQYWWNYPTLWHIGAALLHRLFQLQLFWYLSTRMGPNPLFLFSMLQWVVTHMWLLVDSTRSIGGTIPISLRHWSRYCTYRLFQLQLFWYLQPGWALTSFLFSMLQWVVTYMWLLWMNSTRSIDSGTIPISLRHWSRYCTGSSSSNYFGIFQPGWP